MVEAALLRYLAVAHFGRGRGDWKQGDAPKHWRSLVQEALAPQRGAWTAQWQQRGQTDNAPPAVLVPTEMQPLLRQATLAVLARLYPNAIAPAPTVTVAVPPVASAEGEAMTRTPG